MKLLLRILLASAYVFLVPLTAWAALIEYLASDTHDFGQVMEGSVTKHQFAIRNTVDAPLALTFKQVSCDCTKVTSLPKAIAPGASGRIAVELNASGFGDTQISKHADFTTNAPGQNRLALTIEGTVDVFADIQPVFIRF